MNQIVTVCYADVFDYPLTRKELQEWMIFGGRLPGPRKPYYFLEGRSSLVALRKLRQTWQKEKWEVAIRAGQALQVIPTIQLVGVTGGLAMNNAKKEDDIDLFIIAKSGTLWLTRLLSIVMTPNRRKRKDTNVKNKVCLNMFVSEDNLAVAPRDLFAAHEILQMKPLWNRGGMYNKFLKANAWVRQFLPNAPLLKVAHIPKRSSFIFRLFEPFARSLQLWYMRGHRTREVITEYALQFHPRDARVWVKRKFAVRLRRYNIPLDKKLWAR